GRGRGSTAPRHVTWGFCRTAPIPPSAIAIITAHPPAASTRAASSCTATALAVASPNSPTAAAPRDPAPHHHRHAPASSWPAQARHPRLPCLNQPPPHHVAWALVRVRRLAPPAPDPRPGECRRPTPPRRPARATPPHHVARGLVRVLQHDPPARAPRPTERRRPTPVRQP